MDKLSVVKGGDEYFVILNKKRFHNVDRFRQALFLTFGMARLKDLRNGGFSTVQPLRRNLVKEEREIQGWKWNEYCVVRGPWPVPMGDLQPNFSERWERERKKTEFVGLWDGRSTLELLFFTIFSFLGMEEGNKANIKRILIPKFMWTLIISPFSRDAFLYSFVIWKLANFGKETVNTEGIICPSASKYACGHYQSFT